MSSFLRTRYAALREQLGLAGLVVAIVALIAALAGGAYAADHAGPSAIASKSPVGPRGPRGKTGPQGPVGPAGTNGKDGADGTNGKDGTPGAGGKSVVLGNANGCEEGGMTVEMEGSPTTKREVCNGVEGQPGPRGLPGEDGEPGEPGQTGFTETLPSGETETGTWLTPRLVEVTELYSQTVISFPIPLAAPIGSASWVTTQEQSAHSNSACPGTVESPRAAKGNLCLYQGFTENPTETPNFSVTYFRRPGSSAFGAGTTGSIAYAAYEGPSSPEPTQMSGTWAVTAP
jgi:hypothetical protein